MDGARDASQHILNLPTVAAKSRLLWGREGRQFYAARKEDGLMISYKCYILQVFKTSNCSEQLAGCSHLGTIYIKYYVGKS